MEFDAWGIRHAIQSGHIEWKRHVLERLVERKIARSDVLDVLVRGERIEDYPGDTPYPSALFFGYVGRRPIHVVAAWKKNSSSLAIITTYEPDTDRFEDDFVTRRKK